MKRRGLASEVARMLRRGVSTHTGDKERREKKKAKLEWTPAAAGEADVVPVPVHPVKAQAGAAVARGLPRCAMHVFRHVSKAAGTTMRFIFDKQVRGLPSSPSLEGGVLLAAARGG